MRRRDFLMSLPLAVLMPQLRSAAQLKITGIRIVNLKVLRETGKMEAAWDPGTVTTWRIGGGSIVEIQTDQGLSGIGPGIDPVALEAAKFARVERPTTPASVWLPPPEGRVTVCCASRIGHVDATMGAGVKR